MTTSEEPMDVRTMNAELDELYMVVGSLMYMAAALKKSGTVCHAEKAKLYEELARKYDVRFMALLNDLTLASTPQAPAKVKVKP